MNYCDMQFQAYTNAGTRIYKVWALGVPIFKHAAIENK